MQIYKNRTNKSCVYDAFEKASLPVTDEMLHGIITSKVVELLEFYGYTFHYKDAKVSPKNPFFVIRDWKSSYCHIEYHESIETALDYSPDSIGAVATKE